MTHDDHHPNTDNTANDAAAEQLPCPGRRAMLGCALALTAAQFLGISEAEAATAGKWTSAGVPTSFATGKPKFLKVASGQVPVFITKLSATSFQALLAVCTHEARTINLAPGHVGYAFKCPKHSAKFDKTGKVLANQEANRNLLKLPVKIVNKKVMVNVTGLV